ncbi:hypothetical protein NliqN6_0597 [Naganishia liquefaciens]|uniref:DNA endonuclease activator Ctp1 C-terminal domain-containing protein n=1 Tax=Naganishia liquefaciens TaxID=104408 RepID=A0A8H3TPI9_9TREE|nr:hypothetical protein NliqN6_0597 [Naganishia liquefaciens]
MARQRESMPDAKYQTEGFLRGERDLEDKLKEALIKTARLEKQKKELDAQLAATKDQLKVANVSLECAQSEVFEYRAFCDKYTKAERERDELRRQRDDARQERDETRQQRSELQEELRDLRGVQATHAEMLAEQKKRYGTLMEVYERQIARFGEDRIKIKAQKAEIAELKRQLSSCMKGVVDFAVRVESSVQENDSNAHNAEGIEDKACKRKHNEAFAADERGHDLREEDSRSRHPLSDSSHHNTPTSRKTRKRTNASTSNAESPLSTVPIRAGPVSQSSRVLAVSSQSESMGQQTAIVPLNIDRQNSLRDEQEHQNFAINLHDKTRSRPLVTPDSESEPEIHRRSAVLALGDESKDQAEPIVKVEEGISSSITNQVSKTILADQNFRGGVHERKTIANDPPASVKREVPVPKSDGTIKEETPMRNDTASRVTTPATRFIDKRKLLPIPGWKGGRSSRALTRRDSFEDDDGFSHRTPLVKQETIRSTPIHSQTAATRRAIEKPVPAHKPARAVKHVGIPAHMTTEMTRSRTEGKTAERAPSLRGCGSGDGIRSDPVGAPEGTPLAVRNRNVRKGSEARASEGTGGGKASRHGKQPEQGWESRNPLAAVKGNTSVQEEFEINPERNHGLNYAYQTVERRKEERKKMMGHGCIECENYYNAVGEMPVVSRAPVWRSPSPGSDTRAGGSTTAGKCPHGRTVGAGEAEDAKQGLKNKISRHREDWTAPSTPPMYWNIGFPSTQDVEEINALAEEQRESKRAEMRREAEKKDGRYRRVAK